MKRKIPAFILALLLCAALCVPTASARDRARPFGCVCSQSGRTDLTPEPDSDASAPDTEVSEPEASASAYARELLALVNAARARYGLAALELGETLCSGAQRKAEDLHDAQYFSHDSARYGSPFDMMRSFGISYRTAGENIAMGYDTPTAVMDAWMQSAGHRANILQSSYTTLGVGYVADGSYWVQWFLG